MVGTGGGEASTPRHPRAGRARDRLGSAPLSCAQDLPSGTGAVMGVAEAGAPARMYACLPWVGQELGWGRSVVRAASPACAARGTRCSASAPCVCARSTAPPLGTPGGRGRAARVRVRNHAQRRAHPPAFKGTKRPWSAAAIRGWTLHSPYTFGRRGSGPSPLLRAVPHALRPQSVGLANPSGPETLGRLCPDGPARGPHCAWSGEIGWCPRSFPSSDPAHHMAFFRALPGLLGLGPHRWDVNC